VHTANEAKSWVMVDLGTMQKLGKVKIYNRGDGWFDEVLPLTLELSSDGASFTEVERLTTPYALLVNPDAVLKEGAIAAADFAEDKVG